MPENWSRASPYASDVAFSFCDSIDCPSWVLQTGCHFLGQPIPLIQEDDTCATLLTVGGLFLLYEPNTESDEPVFSVLDPKLSLEEIVAHLSNDDVDNAIVNTAFLDTTAAGEVRYLHPIRRWEARHGIFRWQAFRQRGGKFSEYWVESHTSPNIFQNDLWCTDCCRGPRSCACTIEFSRRRR